MADALCSSLGCLAALEGGLGASPAPELLEELRAAVSAAVACAGRAPGAAHQKELWSAAAALWNKSIEVESGPEDGGAERAAAVAALRQAASDLAAPLPPASLLPPDQTNLVRFHFKAGQAWAGLGAYEAAEAALGRAQDAAQALLPLCFERRGRSAQHQDAAALVLQLLLERLAVALQLGQQMLVDGLVSQACAFAADQRLPAAEALQGRLLLAHTLRAHGQRLAQAGRPAEASPLLSAAYETLSQLDPEEGAEGGKQLAAVAAEAQAAGAQVLTLLAWCNAEAGQPEQAASCLQALQQVAGPAAATHFSHSFLTLRVLLQSGRVGEAEAELLALLANEEATPEACLAGLRAALAAPGGVPLARNALSLVCERFAEEPALVVDTVRAALDRAASAASAPAGAADRNGEGAAGAGAGEGDGAAAEALALELAGDERLMESVCEDAALRQQLAGLLWNHAHGCLGRQAFEAALAFFSAALLLLEPGSPCQDAEEGGGGKGGATPTPAEGYRAMACAALAAGQTDRALEFVAAAEEQQPGALPSAALRLEAQLAARDEVGAVAAVAALAGCPAAGAEALRIACCQCVDAGVPGAARQAMLCLLERCAAAGAGGASAGDEVAPGEGACQLSAPGFEATVFQNLIHLHLEALAALPARAPEADGGGEPAEPADSSARAAALSELAHLFDLLAERSAALGGGAAFFAQAQGARSGCQVEWFAIQAWNAGQAAGAGGALQQAAVLLAVCGQLYAALPAPTPASLGKQQMAYLMAAAAACDIAQSQLAAAEAAREGQAEGEAPAAAAPPPPGCSAASSLALARSYLVQARAAAASLATQQALQGEGGEGPDPKCDVYLLLLDFKLSCLARDAPAQLAALERCKALLAFGAEHFALLAEQARAGGSSAAGAGAPDRAQARAAGASPEVLRAVEAARLQRLTQQAPLDYPAVAATLRALLELSPADPDRLHLLGEAAGLLSAAPSGAWPTQELRWLVTTAWNRGAVHARFGRCAEAAAYQRWALGAVQHEAGLAAQYRDVMQAELERMQAEGVGGGPV